MACDSPAVISDHLYRKILRSIINAVPDKRVGCQPTNLINHVQRVFGTGDDKHMECLKKEERNRPGLDLHLILFEAKNLINANRPFCTISLHRNRLAPFLNPRKESTFPRVKNDDLRDSVVMSDTLTTGCAFESVHPKWEEEFRLFSADYRQEHIHINIWSADMKSSQSLEVKRSPRLLSWTKNQITSKLHLRTSNSEPNLNHDSLGQCMINLRTIPHANWKDAWIPVQTKRKTSGGSPAGEIHIRARLFPHHVQSVESDDPESEFVSIDDYILVMRKFHEYSAKSAHSNHTLYNGDVFAADVKHEVILEQFAAANNISWQCSSILSLGILLQWTTLGVNLESSALVNALESLETALSVMGRSVDCCDESFPHYAENRFFWSSAVCFVRYQVEELTKNIRLFPPNRMDYLAGVDKGLLFLNKLGRLSLFCDMKCDLGVVVAECIESKLKEDVSDWAERNLYGRLLRTESEEDTPSAPLVDSVTALSKALAKFGRYSSKYFQERFHFDYIEVAILHVCDDIYEASKSCVNQILVYQESHVRESVAVQNGSKLSMQLYHAIKDLMEFCKGHIAETSLQSMYLSSYKLLFHECVVYWMKTWDEASSTMVMRSLKLHMALERVDPNMNVAESAVIALNVLVSGVLEDWNNLAIEDASTMLIGVTKIASIFCDSILEYCRYMYKLLMEEDQQQNAVQKGSIMTAANTAMYLGDYLEDKLPGLLKFDQLYEALRAQDADVDELDDDSPDAITAESQARVVLMKMISSSKQASYDISHELIRLVVRKMMPDLKSKMIARVFGETTSSTLLWRLKKMIISPSQFHEITFTLSRMLQAIKDNVHEHLFVIAMEEFWKTSVAIMKFHIAPAQTPEYYHETLLFILAYHEFILSTTGMKIEKSERLEFDKIVQRLKLQSTDTKELMLHYYGSLADDVFVTNMNETTPWLDIQAAHMKLTNDSIYLLINIVEAGNLPELDSNGLCDPFVVLDLQPKTLFPEDSRRETPAIPRTLHPVYDQTFTFQIPTDSFLTHGAVLFLTVWDFDHVKMNDLAGEASIHLANIPQIDCEENLRHLPTVRLPLILPAYDKHGIIEILRLRSRWDTTARKFYHQRLRTILRLGLENPFTRRSQDTGQHIAAMIERVAKVLSMQSFKINID